MMTQTKYTVLFTPLDYHGHINACHGMAQMIKTRGHRVVFAIDQTFKGKLIGYGFEEELLYSPLPSIEIYEGQEMSTVDSTTLKMMDIFEQGTLAMTKMFCVPGLDKMSKNLKQKDSQYKTILTKVKPHLIVIDSYVGSPTLTDSGIPWVWLYSAAPLMAWNNKQLPPPWSGLPYSGNKKEWEQFRKCFEPLFKEVHEMECSWYNQSDSGPLHSESTLNLHPISKYLNIYIYPKELDYGKVPENWKRVDGIVRSEGLTFELPDSLKERPGKLICLSMGSIGYSHIKLMERLVRILGKSEHRFIVALGPLHQMYELADNMWGQPFVAQTAILPLVDLVISHGGNNTITESFYFGKPVLVLPLFGDQFENAQRIQETGLGLRLNPFSCSDEQLLSSVNRLVNDKNLMKIMKEIGQKIRTNDDRQQITDTIENIIEKHLNSKNC